MFAREANTGGKSERNGSGSQHQLSIRQPEVPPTQTRVMEGRCRNVFAREANTRGNPANTMLCDVGGNRHQGYTLIRKWNNYIRKRFGTTRNGNNFRFSFAVP
ncbi:hypothetical protein J6590_044354 [Homalodisca vitripennis]|nr:hypothetical protein J6590_044354 [Homalodisca vitripennis]